MPSLAGATAWLGSPPLTRAQLQGKVVLVDFWEYTCLNCLRTLPYLRTWYQRYHDEGLEIIGVQAPEFAFSGEASHVKDAMARLHITWPVVIDDHRTLWNRFGVQAWPTELLFDQHGHLISEIVGEGNYQHTEAEIQHLLVAQNPHLAMPRLMELLPQDNYLKPGAVCYPDTPEILMAETQVADAPQDARMGQFASYTDPGSHQDGRVYLEGDWNVRKQSVEYDGGNGYFDIPYHAIDVSVVMTPGEKSNRVDVTENNKPVPRADAGKDLRYDARGNSYVDVDASRSYALIANAAFGHYDLALAPSDPGLRIYDVAFESCEVPK